MPKPFLVVGTGRCGTQWMADVLRSVTRRHVTHEEVFTSEGIKDVEAVLEAFSKVGGDVGNGVAAYRDIVPRDTPVLHLVRDPIKVAASWTMIQGFSEEKYKAMEGPFDFRKRECPKTFDRDEYWGRAIRYTREWNMLCELYAETHPYLRCKLEEIDHITLPVIVEFLTGMQVSKELCTAVLNLTQVRNAGEVARDDGYLDRQTALDLILNDPEYDIIEYMRKRYNYA